MQPSKLALLGVMFLSIQAWGQTPPPPPPPPCYAKTVSFTPQDHPNGSFSINIPQRNIGDGYQYDCKNIPVVDGATRWAGKVSLSCEQTGQSSSAWSSLVNGCRKEDARVSCNPTISVGVAKSELELAYTGKEATAREILKLIPSGSSAQGNIARVSMSCGSTWPDGSAVKVYHRFVYNTDSKLKACSDAESGLCYLDPYGGVRNAVSVPEAANSFAFQTFGASKALTDESSGPRKEAVFYVWNKSKTSMAIEPSRIKFLRASRYNNDWPTKSSDVVSHAGPSGSAGGVAAEATSCELKVSGATSTYSNTTPPVVSVKSDVLVFNVNLKGGTGVSTVPPTVTFSGGPDPLTGVWNNPPADGTATVTAKVVTAASKDTFQCSLKINTSTPEGRVTLRRFGDCGYFSALRSHYFHDIDKNGKETPRGKPYADPLTVPGIKAKYGTSKPEVTFAGVLNARAATSGEVVLNSSGKVVRPSVSKRQFSEAVIVAKRFQAGKKVEDPLFYGILNPDDYSTTELNQIDKTQKLDDDDLVVFQAFIAAAQPNQAVTQDLRGTSLGTPYYAFVPETNGGKPYDRIIPFTNESCIPLFQSKPPLRSDVENPSPVLTNVTQCYYSRPFKVSDVRLGRVDLTLMHLVPTHAQHQFPTELLKASSQPTCVAKNPTNMDWCWDMKASSMGVAANADPFEAHTACREETTTWQSETTTSTTRQCYGGGGCNGPSCRNVTTSSTTKVPVTTVTYKASCPVLEKANECTSNIAIRFSGYNQMMMAGLMCAHKYTRPGELVSPTLVKAGILPYTQELGESAPKAYASYPVVNSKANVKGMNYQTSDGPKGVGCIPCRFDSDAKALGRDLVSDTVALPVDQDATSARSPVFSFRRMKAPKECIRDINFEVRYFGSSMCDGVNAPPGHFCSSSNLGGQSCGASDGHGSGNIAGSYKIPICPNSGFEYDNISVSWSPILLDLSGKGIDISRDPARAVRFDIRGDGKQRMVDWPENNDEAAFLVLPNKNGRVTSGRELFGEYQAKDGFAALAKHDSNKDQKIDRNDKNFDQLRLWFDRNRNGIQDDGELETLQAWGVETIYLQHRKITNRGTDGRTLSSVYYNSKFFEYRNVADYYFNEYPTKGAK